MRRPPTNSDLFHALHLWVSTNWPGTSAVEVSVKMANGSKVRFPMPVVVPRSEREPDDGWEPTAAQTAILDALAGAAMKSTELKALPGLEGSLYKRPGGIQELKDRGLVQHSRRRGYWRIDAPPDDWDEDEE